MPVQAVSGTLNIYQGGIHDVGEVGGAIGAAASSRTVEMSGGFANSKNRSTWSPCRVHSGRDESAPIGPLEERVQPGHGYVAGD